MSEASARSVRLYLIRHAETAQNRDGFVQGRADNPLSDLGVRQAAALGKCLAAAPLSAVYSSPLQRALQTANAVAARHALQVVSEPGLTEMDIGEMEGLSLADLRAAHPEFLRAWGSDEVGAVPMPGGESLAQVQDRAGAALDRIIVEHANSSVAVVSHNFVLLTLLCRILALPLHHFRRLRLHVAGVTIVDATGDQRTIEQLNDLCHLRRSGLLGD